MKRTTLILFLALISVPLFAAHILPGTAQKAAENFIKSKTDEKTSLRRIEYADQQHFQHLHVFGNNRCFVIVAGDDGVQPILAYSTENPFNTGKMPENLYEWLQGYEERIAEVAKKHEKASLEIQEEWERLLTGRISPAKDGPSQAVAPLLTTEWAQDAPFNNLCPANTLTGCVATAMAQVMKYWEYPQTGIGSHSYTYNSVAHSADFGAMTYDWQQMLPSYSGNYTEAQATAVATLMRHCGVATEMKYHVNGESGSNIRRASIALSTFFNYTSTYLEKNNFEDDAAWISKVKESLDLGLPLLYGGANKNNPKAGHAFVCDGYDEEDMLHFNWGWGPGSNGYYTVNGHTYSRNQNAVCNIKPITSEAQAPSQLTSSLQDGHHVSLSWNAGNGAVLYHIYRNNTLIGTTETTTVVDDEAVLGDNTYYIRSQDADGMLSLASNCVTVTVTSHITPVDDLRMEKASNTPILTWTTPWWHPQTQCGTIAYVDEVRPEEDNNLYWPETGLCMYWGSRYPAQDLVEHQGKAIYQVSFYTFVPSQFKVLVYQGTTVEQEDDTETYIPADLKAEQSVNASGIGWIQAKLDDPVVIDSSQDLWVFIYDATGTINKIPCLDVSEGNGCQYFSYDQGPDNSLPPHVKCYQLPPDDYAINWYICAHFTDDTYTYNLYDGTIKVNQDVPINGTSYTLDAAADNIAHRYTLKTSHGNVESGASNLAGLTLGTASIASLELGVNDRMTVAEGGSLTVTATLSSPDATNLVVEDGAELVTTSAGVQATVKKHIQAYTIVVGDDEEPTDGWYFIASPITNSVTTNLHTDSGYDLFYLNESDTYWKNYKKTPFGISHKQGYLYANSEETTLSFAGIVQPYLVDSQNNPVGVTVDITKSSTGEGWNLIGNPFPFTAMVNGTNFYKINEDRNGIEPVDASTGNAITVAPCEGIVVQATGENQSVTFERYTATGRTSNGHLRIALTREATNRGEASKASIDQAIISFNEGSQLGKLYFGTSDADLYLVKDHEEYAIAQGKGFGEMPVSFRAHKDGRYTLNFHPEDVEMNYLHLIDHLTGVETDLLANPSYSFEARATDYTSRFKLVFSASAKIANEENFAFVSDEQLVFTDRGTLQVMDLLGHVLHTQTITPFTSHLSALTFPTGVYVLRLINDHETKTQKIIIE